MSTKLPLDAIAAWAEWDSPNELEAMPRNTYHLGQYLRTAFMGGYMACRRGAGSLLSNTVRVSLILRVGDCITAQVPEGIGGGYEQGQVSAIDNGLVTYRIMGHNYSDARALGGTRTCAPEAIVSVLNNISRRR